MIITLSSCRAYRYVYAASKINNPLLQKKSDARINGSFSFGNAHGSGDSSTNKGYDIQAAYALTNHFGLLASRYERKESDGFKRFRVLRNATSFDTSLAQYRRHFTEAGAGYFTSSH